MNFLIIVLSVLVLITIVNKILMRHYNPFMLDRDKHLLIIGDSHTKYAFNDKILNNVCNMSYNADSYFYTYVKMKQIVELNPQIDTVFISFSIHNIHKCIEDMWLFNKSHLHDRLKLYLPMLDFEDFRFLFKIDKSELISSCFGQILFPLYIKLEKKRFGGYEDLKYNNLKNELEKLESDGIWKEYISFEESEIETKYLIKTINLCKSHNKVVVLVNTPLHKSLNDRQENLYQFYNDYFSDILFYDFSKIEMKDEYFGDLVHLNSLGSTYFSGLIEKDRLFKLNNARSHNILYTKPE
ncbi:MAG: hypothetical protein JXL97_02560 [Bacteroidales bacterium]|nr:hypothetical protein [Bacteroidales bacterium]